MEKVEGHTADRSSQSQPSDAPRVRHNRPESTNDTTVRSLTRIAFGLQQKSPICVVKATPVRVDVGLVR